MNYMGTVSKKKKTLGQRVAELEAQCNLQYEMILGLAQDIDNVLGCQKEINDKVTDFLNRFIGRVS